jgi:hypothetical protein
VPRGMGHMLQTKSHGVLILSSPSSLQLRFLQFLVVILSVTAPAVSLLLFCVHCPASHLPIVCVKDWPEFVEF